MFQTFAVRANQCRKTGQPNTTGQSRYIEANTNTTEISHQREPAKVAIRANDNPKNIHARKPVCDPEWRMPQYIPPKLVEQTMKDKIKTLRVPEM